MGEVSVTSASQILESNIWSHVTQQREEPFKNGFLLSLFYEDAIWHIYSVDYYDGNMK